MKHSKKEVLKISAKIQRVNLPRLSSLKCGDTVPPIPVIVGFDLDGTLSFGTPPGPILVSLLHNFLRAGIVIGATGLSDGGYQKNLWLSNGVIPAFVCNKKNLSLLGRMFSSSFVVHVGDQDSDFEAARAAGIMYIHPDFISNLAYMRTEEWLFTLTAGTVADIILECNPDHRVRFEPTLKRI